MKISEKIKKRLETFASLIGEREEIMSLYFSLGGQAKKDFHSIVRLNLIKFFKPHFLSRKESQDSSFYSADKDLFFFENYVFKSVRTKQDSAAGRSVEELIYDPLVMIREVLISKVYEDEEVRVAPKDVVLDCGANIGIFSVCAAKKAGRVYSFEPSPEDESSLRENKKFNNCDNIKIVARAVSDKPQKTKLVLNGTTGHFLADESAGGLEIQATSIDDFVKEEKLEKVDFIKMDIEGSEGKALLGASETLKKFRPKLAISIYHNLNDFYKIPFLTKKLNPEYRIRLKNKEGTLMMYAI